MNSVAHVHNHLSTFMMNDTDVLLDKKSLAVQILFSVQVFF